MHPFISSPIDKTICITCKSPYMYAHSPLSVCDSCPSKLNLEFFPDILHPKKMLLCANCIQNELKTAITASKTDIEQHGDSRVTNMLAIAREQDEAIRYNGDFFNAKVIALETIRESINSETQLSTDEKAFKFQNYLADRIKHLKGVVFELDEKKHQAVTEELVIRKSLRELEKEIKVEIRAKIKEIDSQYEVKEKIKGPAVKPKVKKETLGTFDRLVQAFVLLHGCSKDEAEELIKKGSGGKLGNEKLTSNQDKIPF